ncbi:regulator of chromosome condensation (RCC1) repeat-containing protein [Besnoitia besnoiti]|uniref:Regulator of chromosome condensation (RCC1) repeat-containing protein n=1 Tax=Besnoitia besnoiti TaxID=94643 RepID=A0A2A9M3P7_BESBE|nr:regulator of chromosome condensation (RCC1) repeat-containing protein [Besnoitia besnoiti]PFH31844.1 regulator of chromosome condensation (RCC1) repeat-containing protein [Besnoitia besnoiti]
MGQASTKSGVVVWGAAETTEFLLSAAVASSPAASATPAVSSAPASSSLAAASSPPSASSAPRSKHAASLSGGPPPGASLSRGAALGATAVASASFVSAPSLGVFSETTHAAAASPRIIDSLKGVNSSSVSVGGLHMAVVSQSGELYMWGRNAQGQLGAGDRKDALAPRLVRALQGKIVKVVACAQEHTLCCLDDGSAYAWGCALNGRLGLHGLSIPSSAGLSVSSPSPGGGARTEPLASSCVVCTPRILETLCGYFISDVACGTYHSAFLALQQHKTLLFTCGLGLNGRLGHGDEEDRHLPTPVPALENLNVTAIACGAHHTACVTSGGVLYTWGGAAFGKLGLGAIRGSQLLPKHVGGPLRRKTAVAVALGAQHSACITADGELFTWGQGRRLGHEDQGESDECVPRRVEALAGLFVVQVVCGDAHTACIVENGNVWAWGTSRVLGHGDPDAAPNRPACLRALTGKGVIQLSCAPTFTAAFCDPRRVSKKAAATADVAAAATAEPVAEGATRAGFAGVSTASTASGSTASLVGGEGPSAPAYAGTGLPAGDKRNAAAGGDDAAGFESAAGHAGDGQGGRAGPSARKTGAGALRRTADDAGAVTAATAARGEQPETGSTTAVGGASAASTGLSPSAPSEERDQFLYELGTMSAALQTSQQENLLLAAVLSGTAQQLREALKRNYLLERELDAMRKSSSDAGDRLATLREHYMQQIHQLQEQLAQQDIRLHAILASRSSASSGTLYSPSSRGLPSRGLPSYAASGSYEAAFRTNLPTNGVPHAKFSSLSAPTPPACTFGFGFQGLSTGAAGADVSPAVDVLATFPEVTLEEALLDPLGQQQPPSRFLAASFPSSPSLLPPGALSKSASSAGDSSASDASGQAEPSGALGSMCPSSGAAAPLEAAAAPPRQQAPAAGSQKPLRASANLSFPRETPEAAASKQGAGLGAGREDSAPKRDSGLAFFRGRGRDFLSHGLFASEEAAASPASKALGYEAVLEKKGLALVPSAGDSASASLSLAGALDPSGASNATGRQRSLEAFPLALSGAGGVAGPPRDGGSAGDKNGPLAGKGKRGSGLGGRDEGAIPVFFLEEDASP